jgi:hypothetical protein
VIKKIGLLALLALTLNTPAFAESEGTMAKQALMLPVRMAAIGSGMVVGIPVAIVRRTGSRSVEFTEKFADNIGGKRAHDSDGHGFGNGHSVRYGSGYRRRRILRRQKLNQPRLGKALQPRNIQHGRRTRFALNPNRLQPTESKKLDDGDGICKPSPFDIFASRKRNHQCLQHLRNPV